MITGIYKLDFPGTEKVYIGQAKDIIKRIKEHLYTFKNNTASKKLQQAYNTYGEPSYTILCECTIEELNATENEAIDIFNSCDNGFNTFRLEGGSIRAQGGLTHSNSKYTKREILKIFSLLYRTTIPYTKIATRTNLSKYLVHNIASGLHHLWLKAEYPDQFKLMLDNKLLRNKQNKKNLASMGNSTPTLYGPNGIIYENITNIAELCRNDPILSTKGDNARSAIGKLLKGNIGGYCGFYINDTKI